MEIEVSTWLTRLKALGSHVTKTEVAEALVASFCVEYLRVRRFGGFRVVEVVAISIMMMAARAIMVEANKRRDNGKTRSFEMSNRYSSMEQLEFPNNSYRPHHRSRRPRFS